MPGIGDVTRNSKQTLTSKKLSLQTSFASSDVGWAPTVNIDFDSTPFQTLNLLGSTAIRAINVGAGKTVTLKMKNATSSDWLLNFDSDHVFVGGLAPKELKSGKVALVSFTAFGGNQSAVIIGYANQK